MNLLLAFVLWLSADQAAFVTVCSDGGAGAYEAFPDVCRLVDGRLLCVFYDSYGHVGLPNEKYPRGGRVSAATSSDEGATWSKPFVIYDGPRDDRDPSIAQLPDGRLICNFFCLDHPENKSSALNYVGHGTWMVTSDDGGKTWSDARQIATSYCSSPIRALSTGRLILGMYDVREVKGDGSDAWGEVITSDDSGKTWSKAIKIPNGGRRLDAETDVIELKDGSLLAVQRAEREPMAWSISKDKGDSWSVSQSIGFPGHCPYLHRAPGDIILLAHRVPHTSLHYSTDEGKTWSENVVVDDHIGAYPSMVTRKDGSILIVYYEEGEGSNIRARRFRATPSGIEWLPVKE